MSADAIWDNSIAARPSNRPPRSVTFSQDTVSEPVGRIVFQGEPNRSSATCGRRNTPGVARNSPERPVRITGSRMLSCSIRASSTPTSSDHGETRQSKKPGMTTPGTLAARSGSDSTLASRTSASTSRPLPCQIVPLASASRTRPAVNRSSARSAKLAGACHSTTPATVSRPASAMAMRQPVPRPRLMPLPANPRVRQDALRERLAPGRLTGRASALRA